MEAVRFSSITCLSVWSGPAIKWAMSRIVAFNRKSSSVALSHLASLQIYYTIPNKLNFVLKWLMQASCEVIYLLSRKT